MSSPRKLSKSRLHIPKFAAILFVLVTTVAGSLTIPTNAVVSPSDVRLENLTINGRINPLEIPGDTPVFGWGAVSQQRGVIQSAYKIQVGSSEDTSDVWDSGKTASRDQVGIRYGDPETFRFSNSLGLDGPARGNVPQSQTAYAVALGMDLITDPQLREKTAGKFVEKLAADNNHLTTGSLGVSWLLPALSINGHDEIAFEVLMQEDYPGWPFEVPQGTITRLVRRTS